VYDVEMPIVQFENNNQADLTLTVQPWNEMHTVPHRAIAGIRYALSAGAEDRSFVDVTDRAIEFWCNADSYEIEITYPSNFENLLWEICVVGGWCGDIVDGNPTHVCDLIPQTGEVTSRQFAELVMRADGWPDDQPLNDKHAQWLEAKFVEHLASASVDAGLLRTIHARPFEGATT
jgi:hypothetical protein